MRTGHRHAPEAADPGCRGSLRACTSCAGSPPEGVTDVVYSIGYLGEHDPRASSSATGPLGLRRPLRRRGRPPARAPGARSGSRSTTGVLDAAFFVLYGDSYLPIDCRAVVDRFAARRARQALMTVFRNEGQWDTSNVVFDGRSRRALRQATEPDPARSGMRHIDYGLSMLAGGHRA